jgi:hypothetical protein
VEHYASVPGTPLTPADEAILRLEGPVIAGHTCKVVVLAAGAPSLDELRARVAAGLERAPALRTRLHGEPGQLTWVRAEDFDIADHVVEPRPEPIAPGAVREAVAGLFTEHLDRARPLWRIDMLRLNTGGSVLVWRLHHTVADGTTAMRYARALLWDADAEGATPGARGASGEPAAAHPPGAPDEHRRRTAMAHFFAREFRRERSPFDGAIGVEREVAFARLPLRPLHDAAKELAGATVNDALVCAIGGGIRSWLERCHGHAGQMRVKVPVSLHHPGDDLGNADSFFFVDVPLEHDDPVQRLRAVHAETARRKAEHDAEKMDRVLRDLRAVSPRLQGLCERVERSGRAFALNVSNVPGPREPVTVCGAQVESLHSLAEIARHHAVRVAAVSLCDELFLGFCADPAIVDGVQAMAEGAEQEAQRLIAAA